MSNSQIGTIAEIAQKVSVENDRRHRQTQTINDLLSERQEVLVALCQLADLNSGSTERVVLVKTLKSFSQTLVDYTALGHFEIYERIIDDKERRASVNQIADRVYPNISITTQKFVDFNDKYDGVDDMESLAGLHQDLSDIGEALAERIESEDKLLREMSDRMFDSDSN